MQNYASHVPPKVSHITFAHEVGHNFGSPVSTVGLKALVSLQEKMGQQQRYSTFSTDTFLAFNFTA